MYNHINVADSSIAQEHTKEQSQLPVVDRLLEPQTILSRFLAFASGRPLSNGSWSEASRTDATLLSTDEVAVIQANFPPGSEEPSILDRVMSRIGSNEDGERLCVVGKNIQALKSRLWEGIVPISDERWREKGLDRPENLTEALRHLSAVLAVFAYLNENTVRGYLRDTYNLIYDHWESLDTVLNEQRAKAGKGAISVANLWAVYMTYHYRVMTQRSHHWVTKHVEELRAPVFEELRSYKGPAEETQKPDQVHWRLTNALQQLLETSVRADYTIWMPMEGYKGCAPQEFGSGPPELLDADITKRGPVFAGRLKVISHKIMIDKILDPSHKSTGKTLGETYYESAMEQIQAQQQVRKELRGEDLFDPEIKEPWISSIISEKEESNLEHGIVIYRLTYNQTESEWSDFVTKLEAHISGWGGGQTGSDEIKGHLRLKWVDGNGFGFSEDDIEAAKAHFKQSRQINEASENLEEYLNDVFLAVDSASFASYTTDSFTEGNQFFGSGDMTGFVLAVDADYDAEEGIERPDESPGYNGQMRVLGSLVWGDLYALISSQSTHLDGLWPLAMNHPNQVYHGPTLPWNVEIKPWRVVGLVIVLILFLLLVWYILRWVWRLIF